MCSNTGIRNSSNDKAQEFARMVCTGAADDIQTLLNYTDYTESTFSAAISTLNKQDIKLSIFHLNIRSLNKNIRSLQLLLSTLDVSFDVIVLSEIWTINIDFYTS